MHQFCLVSGVTDGWATLGLCYWQTFSARISQEFRDLHHDFRNKTKLLDLCQHTSVSKYNDEFWSLMMEVRQVMSSADMLLAYLRGLKPSIQQQVMLTAPAMLSDAMYAANFSYWFSHQWNKPLPSSHSRGGHGKWDGPVLMELGAM